MCDDTNVEEVTPVLQSFVTNGNDCVTNGFKC